MRINTSLINSWLSINARPTRCDCPLCASEVGGALSVIRENVNMFLAFGRTSDTLERSVHNERFIYVKPFERATVIFICPFVIYFTIILFHLVRSSETLLLTSHDKHWSEVVPCFRSACSVFKHLLEKCMLRALANNWLTIGKYNDCKTKHVILLLHSLSL